METVVKVITARLRQENAFEQLPALTFPERAVPTRRVGATVRRSSLHVVTFHENRGKQSQPFQGNARVAQPEEVPGSLGWRRLKSSTGHMQSSTDNTNQNSTVKSKYLRKPKKSNKQFKSQMVSLSDLKKVFNLSSPEVALDAYKNNSDFKSKIDSLALEVGVNRMGALEQRLGSKLIHHLEPTFDSLPKSEKMAHIMAVLADDLGAAWQLASPLVKPVLSKLATTYGPKLVDWLYSQAS